MTEVVQQRLLEILKYWHNIEFFIPFDLNQITDTPDDWKLRWLGRSELTQLPATFFSQLIVPSSHQITGYRLYLGVFDKAEIARTCATSLSYAQQVEEEERGELEGRTCFARLALNALGEPVFDPLSVSTVPWALGQVTRHGLSSLGLESFESSLSRLKDGLQNFKAQRRPAVRDQAGLILPNPLLGFEMLALHELFAEWAGFTPDSEQPPILLEILALKKNKQAPSLVGQNAEAQADAQNDDDDDDEVSEEPGIDILNSFYIEDIERVMRIVRDGVPIPMLASYLMPPQQERRIDMYSDAGRAHLLRMLHPSRGNYGHWLEDDSRSMSLMQQFAINASLEGLVDCGLFSVNGPPGTGKTTLLREIFVENIVRRAEVLSGLEYPADAFTSKVKVTFANTTESTTISCLRADLTGFEMVVASSNNAAVENISRDLPKSKQLGKAWAGTRYLQTVAQRLVAEDEDGNISRLPEGEQPWGLISCALGNSKNRRRFVSKFYYPNKNEKAALDPSCRNIRQWVSEYAGPGFRQARVDYRAVACQVRERREILSRCADLWERLHGLGNAEICQWQQAFDEALSAAGAAMLLHTNAQAQLSLLQERQAELTETERLLDRSQPGFWARLIGTTIARTHREKVVQNADAQRAMQIDIAEAKRRLADCASSRAQCDAVMQAARATLEIEQRARQDMVTELAALSASLEVRLPVSVEELEHNNFQIDGLWHDRVLAGLRSSLFEKALILHEAWLAAVARQGGGFGGNLFAIAKLLEGRRPEVAEHTALIWQSLFMVVPVVSTTFASFARQFRDLGTGQLGWLFIDEAGQAVPQAAVGALWRARRAMVVGDPRQIEPVFTVPLSLIRGLSQLSRHTVGEDFAPDKVSVQRLADDANRYGTLVPQPNTQGIWIGSPLRVHRRCTDPMFTLSNAIAYDEKMVYGLDYRLPLAGMGLGAGPSAWIQIAGSTSFKQVVPAQIAFIVEMVARLYARDGKLPDLYLISPFKAIKNELKIQLLRMNWSLLAPQRKAPKKSYLSDWCKKRVGTVHTFQGKEEGTVFMVLGTDAEHAGAAAWASAKPNLLNVALTRAQHYFYMVGDAAVWRGLPYFSDALAVLPPANPQAFLDGLL